MSSTSWAGVLLSPVDLSGNDSASPRLRVVLAAMNLGLQGVVRLAISVLVGQQAGPSALAQVASGLAVASLLSLLWPSATGTAASRFIAAARQHQDPDEARRVTTHLGRRTLQASALLAPVATVYWIVRGGSATDGIIVGALTLGLGGYAFVRGVHNGANQLIRLVAWDCGLSLLAIIATFAVLVSGLGGTAALAPLAASYLILTLCGWPRGGHSTPDTAAEMDHFVLWGTIGSIASAGLIHITMLVADHRMPGDEAGQFAAALNLVAPAALLANSLSMALFPQISAAFARGEDVAAIRLASRATDAMVLIIGATFGGLSLIAPWVVVTLWGAPFAPAAAILPVLAIGPLARAVSMPAVTTISSRDRAGVRKAGTSTVLGLVAAVIIWTFAPGAPWLAIALGYSTAMLVTSARNVYEAVRRDQLPWVGSCVRLAVGATVVAAACFLRDRQDWGLLPMALICTVALALWIVTNRSAARSLIKR